MPASDDNILGWTVEMPSKQQTRCPISAAMLGRCTDIYFYFLAIINNCFLCSTGEYFNKNFFFHTTEYTRERSGLPIDFVLLFDIVRGVLQKTPDTAFLDSSPPAGGGRAKSECKI